jgi:uncharacterized membrane protein YhaH (DUF805 family)
MSTEAWIAVGVVVYLVMGVLVVGVVLGLSPTEISENLSGVQMLALVLVWFAVLIIGLVVAVTACVNQWREKPSGERDPKGTEAETGAK